MIGRFTRFWRPFLWIAPRCHPYIAGGPNRDVFYLRQVADITRQSDSGGDGCQCPALCWIALEAALVDFEMPGTCAKAIEINVTPEKETEARPDSVFVNVSHKHLIWLVWLGLTMITAGGCYGYVRSLKS